MPKPKRIQRKRSSGWRMPEGAVSVTRPGKWGNPFMVAQGPHDGMWMVDCKSPAGTTAQAAWIWDHIGPLAFITVSDALAFSLAMYRAWVILLVVHSDVDLTDIRGKDLACWCKEGDPCHGDVLIEIANKE